MPMDNRLMVPRRNYDADALRYLNAVQLADGQALEPEIQAAVDAFVRGCKADGTWSAIKASCIMCGARTISGALVPLVGTAPTAYNFTSANYNRSTGLVGLPASGTYIDTNRAGNASDSDDTHLSLYFTSAASFPNIAHAGYITSTIAPADPSYSLSFLFKDGANNALAYYLGGTTFYSGGGSATGFSGYSATGGSSFTSRLAGTDKTGSFTKSLYPANYYIFARNNVPGAAALSDARIAFYSIGSALDLAALDNRVSTLVAAIAAAI